MGAARRPVAFVRERSNLRIVEPEQLPAAAHAGVAEDLDTRLGCGVRPHRPADEVDAHAGSTHLERYPERTEPCDFVHGGPAVPRVVVAERARQRELERPIDDPVRPAVVTAVVDQHHERRARGIGRDADLAFVSRHGDDARLVGDDDAIAIGGNDFAAGREGRLLAHSGAGGGHPGARGDGADLGEQGGRVHDERRDGDDEHTDTGLTCTHDSPPPRPGRFYAHS